MRTALANMEAQVSNRRQAAIDLVLTAGFAAASIVWLPWLNPALRQLKGFPFVLTLAAVQFSVEGLLPLIIITMRRESFADYGFHWRRIGNSLGLATLLVIIYDLALSLHARVWLFVPFRRHNVLRNALATGFPLNIIGVVIVIGIWGFVEGCFGVYFARKMNQLFGRNPNGWLAPGVLGFALFNGTIHAAIGQGMWGFLTSFVSGYCIAAIPAVTKNAWGSGLFQTATNAAGAL